MTTTDPRALALAKARQQRAHRNPFNAGFCPPWDGLTGQEQHLSLLDARNYLRAAIDAGLIAVPPAAAPPTQAAVPVKQRADCTELEWAEQERARFERLYTREFSRAEKAEADANHNADLVATAARRAEAMERAMESTAADALAHRGCHRDLMAQCLRAERAEADGGRFRAAWLSARHRAGVLSAELTRRAPLLAEYAEAVTEAQKQARNAERIRENADFHLGQEMARRQLAEKETARLSADRASVLDAAAQHLYTMLFPAVYDDMGQKAAEGVQRAVSELRRLAEAPQPETQAGHSCSNCDGIDPDTCLFNPDRPKRPPMDPVHILGIDAEPETQVEVVDQPRITADGDGVLVHLPEIAYLDTQVWAVDIGLTADALRVLRDAATAHLAAAPPVVAQPGKENDRG